MDALYRSTLTESETVAAGRAEDESRQKFAASEEGVSKARIRRYLRMSGLAAAVAAVLALIFGPFALQLPGRITGSVVVGLFFLATVLPIAGYLVYENAASAWIARARASAIHELQEEQARKLADSKLESLLIFNRDDMRQYHQIALSVARRASRLSSAAMVVGFLVLVAGAIYAISVDDPTGKIVVGALTALGGLFSGFITKTFFRAEENAVNQLYKYWQQPRAVSYLLAAERVAMAIPGRSQERELAKVIEKALSIVLENELKDEAMKAIGNGASASRRVGRQRNTSKSSPPTGESEKTKAEASAGVASR